MADARDRGWGPGWPTNRQKDMVKVTHGDVFVWVHKGIAPLIAYLFEATTKGGYRIKAGETWGYANRPIKGTDTPSNHSWGLAVDINAPSNPWTSKLVTDMPAWMVELWEEHGFRWGGRYAGKKDAMHYEFMGTPGEAAARVARLSGVKTVKKAAAPQVAAEPKPQVENRVTVTDAGEVELVRVHTLFIQWQELDGEGRGWVTVPYPLERVLSVEGQGSYPPSDGYWPPIACTVNGRGPETVVTLAGAPGQGGGLYARVLLDD